MANVRRKTDQIQYKLIMGVISFVLSSIIGIGSFFMGQMAKATEEGFQQGIQKVKIIKNEEQVKLLNDKLKHDKKDHDLIRGDIHKIDKNVVSVSTKIDFLIAKEKAEIEKKSRIAKGKKIK